MESNTHLLRTVLLSCTLLCFFSFAKSTVSDFPYAQGFETSCLGSWTQDTGDDLNWTRLSGATGSSSTGPSSAYEGSYYMYVEASSPNYPSKTAILTSDYFDVSAMTNPMFSFSYHMYGSNMGSLYLEISPDGTTWYHVWSKTGDQGNAWDGIVANLASYKSVPFKLRFRAVTGAGYTSDIAIDDVTFAENNITTGGDDPACGGGGSSSDPCDNPVSSFPYSNGFESGIGDWTQNTGDDINWTRKSGSTSSSGTGPSSAYAGAWYVYTEASGYSNSTAILTSPCFDVSSLTNPLFNWNYHMYGSNMGSLYLEISPDGTTWYHVWSKTGDQGNQWHGVNANLAAYKSQPFQLRFRGVTGNGFRSDIALDDIEFYEMGTQKGAPADLEQVTAVYLEPARKADPGTLQSNLMVYPNPASQSVSLAFEQEMAGQGRLTILNAMGQQVLNQNLEWQAGRNDLKINFDLPTGSYLLRVDGADAVMVERFNVVR